MEWQRATREWSGLSRRGENRSSQRRARRRRKPADGGVAAERVVSVQWEGRGSGEEDRTEAASGIQWGIQSEAA